MKTNIECNSFSNFNLWRAARRLAASKLVWSVGSIIGLAAVLVFSWQGMGARGQSAEGVWQRTERTTEGLRLSRGVPKGALVLQLDEAALRATLAQALPDRMGALEESLAVVSLPMPEGRLARFRVVNSPVMAAALAAQHPQIKSYRGQGADNPSLTMRCSLTPSGFSALVSDGARTVMIQPLAWFRQAPPRRVVSAQATSGGSSQSETAGEAMYVSYYGQDYARAAEEAACLVKGDAAGFSVQRRSARARRASAAANFSYGETLRTYRIAIATTQGYKNAVAGIGSLNSINSWLNGVNGILEKELSIRLVLASPAIYNTNYGLSDDASDATLNSVRAALKPLDLSTYDLAHVLGVGNSGNAYVGGLCEPLSDSNGPYKAGGITLLSGANVVNDSDLIALLHEIGHQLGATHTYNAGCGGGRVGDTAFEPGGGATIMSKGNGCGADSVISAITLRNKNFHSGSLAQIIEFLDSYGGTCGTATSTGNAAPTVNAGADYIIPKQTPFMLTGIVKDPTGQTLTYHWEQIDAGGAFANPLYGDQAGDPVETTRPLFHSVAAMTPTAEAAAQSFLSGTPSGFSLPQHLPGVNRALNFRLTARDNQSGGGGVASDTIRLEVTDNAGPLAVTSPNTNVTWAANSTQTVTWSRANTHLPPINCATVNILFSADGGQTYVTLARNTVNDESETITVPNVNTSQARIKVEAAGNVFFDASDTNFTVNNASGCGGALIGPSDQNFSNSAGKGTVNVLTGSVCGWTATSNATWITIDSGASGTGAGAVVYSVTENMGTTRIGTMTIAGKTFTVVQLGPSSGNGLMFYPLARPIRLLETRNNSNYPGCFKPNDPISANTTRTQSARGICDSLAIPANAAAITGNITVIPAAAGSLTLFASDIPKPNVENSNFNAGEVTNNVFTVALSAFSGEFNIHTSATTEVIVDVTGYYAPPGPGGLYYHPLPSPVRLLQTYPGQTGCFLNNSQQLAGTNDPNANPALDLVLDGRGTGLPSPCNSIPGDAVMLVGNATTVQPQAPLGFGYLTIYPSDAARPTVASSNYNNNDIINGPFAVKLGADGRFKVYTFSTTHLVIDISGYYSTNPSDANGAGMFFTPLSKPVRLLETRDTPPSLPGCSKLNAKIQPGYTNPANHYTQPVWGTCEEVMISNQAVAIVGNATVTNQTAVGFLTFWPGNISTAPVIATSNHPASSPQGYNRHFFVGLGPDGQANAGAFKLLSFSTTDLRVDVSGYFAP